MSTNKVFSFFLIVSLGGCGGLPAQPTTIPENERAVVCQCQVQIPLSCLNPGCGLPPGTHVNGRYCSVDRTERLCLSNNEPDQQCQTARNVFMAALLRAYDYCLDNCDIQVSCEAAQVQQVSSCVAGCPEVPFARNEMSGDWNIDTATYVAGETRFVCEGSGETWTDTAHVCRH